MNEAGRAAPFLCHVAQSYEGSAKTYSTLIDQPYSDEYSTCKGDSNYTDSPCYYTSGLIHSVQLTGLQGGASYSYSVAADTKTWSFRAPPTPGSQTISFGVV